MDPGSALRADHRGRGIAKALLRVAFDLYLQIGMVVRATWVHYSKLLRPTPNL